MRKRKSSFCPPFWEEKLRLRMRDSRSQKQVPNGKMIVVNIGLATLAIHSRSFIILSLLAFGSPVQAPVPDSDHLLISPFVSPRTLFFSSSFFLYSLHRLFSISFFSLLCFFLFCSLSAAPPRLCLRFLPFQSWIIFNFSLYLLGFHFVYFHWF